jgi:hypothetical protein
VQEEKMKNEEKRKSAAARRKERKKNKRRFSLGNARVKDFKIYFIYYFLFTRCGVGPRDFEKFGPANRTAPCGLLKTETKSEYIMRV